MPLPADPIPPATASRPVRLAVRALLRHEDRLLIVDDVYSTGLNVAAVLTRLKDRLKRNMPEDVRIAVPWYKPARNQTGPSSGRR